MDMWATLFLKLNTYIVLNFVFPNDPLSMISKILQLYTENA